MPMPFNRTLRLLILVVFIALQAMSPFIHAHAGSAAVQPTDATGYGAALAGGAGGGWLHVHPRASSDAACQANALHEGAAVEVAPGTPARASTAPRVVRLAAIVVAVPVATAGAVSARAVGALDSNAPPPGAPGLHRLPPACAPPAV